MAESVHRIRLLGPWQYEFSRSDCIDGQLSGQVRMPCEWSGLFGSVAGRARFSRRFHKPTNLDADEAVFLVLTGVGGQGAVELNDRPVATIPRSARTFEADITSVLSQFNLLHIDLEWDPAHAGERGGLYDPVQLEIRRR